MSSSTLRLLVVGAGVVGLSTAAQLQARFPSASVHIIADRFGKDTTSDGAAGIFRPTLSKTPGVPLLLLKKWLNDSWSHYDRLVHSEQAAEAGVQMLSGYFFSNKELMDTLDRDIVYEHRPLNSTEMAMFPGEKFKYGYFVTTIMTECRRYLPYLMAQFRLNGGGLENRHLSSLQEFAGKYDVVVNCTGIGSQKLLNDEKLVPIRGQLLRVNAPWLKHFVYTGDDANCYIVPGINYVVIGGTHDRNDSSVDVRPSDTQAIWARACKVVPSLKKATIEWAWAGLRPHREPLRLEKEEFVYPTGRLWVVHNYGHGAEGVSLSWGTATAAVDLVAEILGRGKLSDNPSAKL